MARILVEFSTEALEFVSKCGVEQVAREAERGRGKLAHGRLIRAGNEPRAVDANGAGAFEQRQQTETFQNCRAVAADEFAADAVARIVAGFENCGRNAALSEADAERETGEPAADDRDGSRCGHFSLSAAR